jgi:hypothetical protein
MIEKSIPMLKRGKERTIPSLALRAVALNLYRSSVNTVLLAEMWTLLL